jgi:ribosomal protein S12
MNEMVISIIGQAAENVDEHSEVLIDCLQTSDYLSRGFGVCSRVMLLEREESV